MLNCQEYKTKDEWLAGRLSGIGGSEVAAIVGESPWAGAHDVWMRKVGTSAELKQTEPMKWGTLLENEIAEEWKRLHGKKFRQLKNPLFRHPKYDFMIGSPDRLIYPVKEKTGLEIKNIGWRSGLDWPETGSDEIPGYYRIQIQWYMYVTGLDHWWLAALLGGQDYREYPIESDPELQELLAEEVHEFWENYVVPKRAPEVDGTASCRRYLDTKFAKNKTPLFDVTTADDIHKLENYKNLLVEKKAVTADVKAAENAVIALIGEAEGVQWNGNKLTYKKQNGSVSWKSVAESLNPTKQQIDDARGKSFRKFHSKFKKEE